MHECNAMNFNMQFTIYFEIHTVLKVDQCTFMTSNQVLQK